jgi:hypothetical protein
MTTGMSEFKCRAAFTIGICSLAMAASFATSKSNSAIAQGIAILPDIVIATNVAVANSDTTTPGRPGVGWDGTNYLVVTSRSGNDPRGLVGVILSSQGVPIHEFAIGGQVSGSPDPSLAFDGTNYLLVFNREGQIYGLRISPHGQLLDPSDGFPISSGTHFQITNYRANVASDGQNFFVVWQKYQNPDYDIYRARVTRGGQVLDEFPIFRTALWQTSPQVAFDGINYLVVWEHEHGTWPDVDSDIYGARVSPAGTIFDPAGIRICSAINDQVSPHLAFDGQAYLVVWLDRRDHAFNPYVSDIFAARVTTNGVVLDGQPSGGGIAINSLFAEGKRDPRVCFDGKDFFVTWWLAGYSPPAGSFGVRVSSGGVLLDGPPENQGMQIRAPGCYACEVTHPNPVSNHCSVLVPWINNAELNGTYKTVFANLIVPEPRIMSLNLGVLDSEDVKLTFTSRLDVPYLVEWSSNLISWQVWGSPVEGSGLPMEVILPGGAGADRRFFRIQVHY